MRSAATAWTSRSRITMYTSPATSTSALSSGSNSTLSPTSTARACGPTATTRDQASRRAPMAAVAGMTMPPLERRSPASWSSSTRIRSWSILMGVLSLTVLLDDLAGDDEERDDADGDARDLEDVVGAWLPGRPVHEVRLDAADLAPDDRLGVRAVEELVDGGRQALPGLLDLKLESGHLLVLAHV